jgi:hypothetical protein
MPRGPSNPGRSRSSDELHPVPRFQHIDGPIATGPVGRERSRLPRDCAPPPAHLGLQRLVMRPGGTETAGADDGLARIVPVAMAPRCRSWPGIAHDLHEYRGQRTLQCFDGLRTVAAEVARVGPGRPVLVEVPRREQVHRQRCHARRRSASRRAAQGHQQCPDEGIISHLSGAPRPTLENPGSATTCANAGTAQSSASTAPSRIRRAGVNPLPVPSGWQRTERSPLSTSRRS